MKNLHNLRNICVIHPPRSRTIYAVPALVFLLATACSSEGNDADSGQGGAPGKPQVPTELQQLPAEETQSSVETFLQEKTYRQWQGDPAIRSTDSSVNVHGDNLRVFFNDKALQSTKNYITDKEADPSAILTSLQGSMVVKEIYETDGSLIATAMQWKTGAADTMRDWTYYCNATTNTDLCTGMASELPVFGVGDQACGYCHSQSFYAKPPQ